MDDKVMTGSVVQNRLERYCMAWGTLIDKDIKTIP